MAGEDYRPNSGTKIITEGEIICAIVPIKNNEVYDGKRHFFFEFTIPCFDLSICFQINICDDDEWSTFK